MKNSNRFATRIVVAVSLSALCAFAPPALADDAADAEAERDRTYAPTDIVVTGHIDGYAVADGSTALLSLIHI